MTAMTKYIDAGAQFSECGQYRYTLWRRWDDRPLVMFIGLNPSKATKERLDRTTESVERIARHNGYGGFYMMNLFTFISTNPDHLKTVDDTALNHHHLRQVAGLCQDVVFAWGGFPVIKKTGRDKAIIAMFPFAKMIRACKDGSPVHPLFQLGTTVLQPFTSNT